MSLHLWLGFLAATLVVALSPGPGAVLSMSVGMRHGYWHALKGIAGLQTALLMQLALVAMGLGALLAASEAAFMAVKLAGAGYLVWLGVRKWNSRVEEGDPALEPDVPEGFYRQGILVNLGNPKAIIFIAALVPQFINPAEPQLPQFLIIAGTTCTVDTMVMSCYALLASRLRRVTATSRAALLQNRIFGGLFISAGLFLAGSSRH
ncbi:LysE family transporter [Zoogloea sp.]|jgi:homoserine/homoserine lactone efflux protein|uniref:LysE family transporter n=1 Tax=Zoogloea sp. TaxID=49181 RepID=UPI0011D7CA2B|nr:LysE family transporter [Zoogloea sp.]MBK6656278.1 LysE family transporter [Zoogloea sp.]MBK7847120.1 LysE family transporter [Zoogloea sp.]MBP7446295.1 LysE family transporter [Zoogloea sp.]TXG98399.1 MAG: homoserine/homoserine lactone efflux protein [Zoogloea sp.]